ncbi:hypothetical protein [Metabacillus idriensis]|uniref:hypothetical protein n=1 Tax=Metabacillus idriensis TaxID=324768 RepID=UPI003D2861D5
MANLYLPVGAEQSVPLFCIVQLHRPTPRPERIIQQRQKAPSLADPYLSVGAKRAIPLF